ncbi:glucan endo-1,3-beta-glucosidase, acidic [Cryptomeria japonica]|uniref:glucan endo-1,3-beta-glucosidase, acidic n=1 Tax=Cryptomeria japonica TaxID=3369 RepID=UPI0027DA10B0|nr:glucan endo-1,3-beta-glucosidase, acidic [Cryptomeria japonica]
MKICKVSFPDMRNSGHFISSVLFILFFCTDLAFFGAEAIGVCYGRVGDNLPSPVEVAAMYTSHRIGKMRIYDADQETLRAFQNTGIQVTVGVPNENLPSIASSQETANQWVADNIQPHYPTIQFKYISVGNEILPDTPFTANLFPAMKNIYNALQSLNLQNQIKVSTPMPMSILSNSYPPSAGTFSPNIIPIMRPILNFLSQTKSPFMADVYPYFAYISDPKDISLAYALFQMKTPNEVGYKNLFDASVDALIYAMEALGHSDIPIVIAESGWPSKGNPNGGANISNAQIYNNNFIKHVLCGQGTPKRPNQTIEAFVFAMFNEDLKPGDITEKHFGLFQHTKAQVYPVNFTG